MIGGDLTRLEHAKLFNDVISRRPFDVVFKREYIAGTDLGPNVFPLPFSFNFDQIPTGLPESKKYDVSFWAVESNPLRTKALDLLADKFDCTANGTARGQIAKHYKRKGMHYLRELAACRIVLNIPGVGWDTQRYWEVPAVGGFMVSVKPQIVIPNNFEDGKHLVFCKDDLSDLIELCQRYLREESQREAIARNAFTHCKQYHSDLARAEFIVQKLSAL
jgi:hypothetical protein